MYTNVAARWNSMLKMKNWLKQSIAQLGISTILLENKALIWWTNFIKGCRANITGSCWPLFIIMLNIFVTKIICILLLWAAIIV